MPITTSASICLLAGRSTRMGSPKQHVQLWGRSFLDHILSTLSPFRGEISARFFVGQPGDVEGRKRVLESGGIWLENPRPEDGPLSSIRIALGEIVGGTAFLLWPVDHPLVSAGTLEALIEARSAFPELIIVPSHGNRRGHPAFFPPWAAPELLRAPLEEGARWLLRSHPEKVHHVPVEDPWVVRNLNTPELLQEAESWLRGNSDV